MAGMENSCRSAGPPAENDVQPATIMVVDDEDVSAAALEETCVAIPGVKVLLVSSGLDAARILEDRPGEVHAVLTDIRMPGMDGFELIRFIRGRPPLVATPVIVVTADVDPDSRERARRLGADAYFSKPFSPKAVRLTLEMLLHAKAKPK